MNEKNNIQKWYENILEIFKTGMPEFYRWINKEDVVRALKTASNHETAVVISPNKDQKSLFDVRASSQSEKHIALRVGKSLDDFIDLELSDEILNRYPKPKKETKRLNPEIRYSLLLEHFGDNGTFTYFRLLTTQGPHIILAKESALLNHDLDYNQSTEKLKANVQNIIRGEY
jgi:hypothetical protein